VRIGVDSGSARKFEIELKWPTVRRLPRAALSRRSDWARRLESVV
jgi:hypothetical protein